MMRTISFVLLTLAAASRSAEQVQAESRARSWLKAHGDADPDSAGMADLKQSDPGAFAIVQALLAKKQLGLLDPSHPSAAFGGAAAPKPSSFSEDMKANGISADSPSAEVAEAPEVAMVAVHPVHHDPWSFRAHDDDDQMVQSVLGAVSEVKGKSGSLLGSATHTSSAAKPAPRGPSSFSFNWGSRYASTPAVAAKVQPKPEVSSDSVSSGSSSSSSLISSQQQLSDSTGMTSKFSADADSLGVEQVLQEENAADEKLSLKTKTAYKPVVAPSLSWGDRPREETNVQAEMPAASPSRVQPRVLAAGQQNSYLNGWDSNFGAAEASLDASPFHKHMMEVRAGVDDEQPKSVASMSQGTSQVSQATLGDSYSKDLQAARTSNWQKALDATSWGHDAAPKTEYLQQPPDTSEGAQILRSYLQKRKEAVKQAAADQAKQDYSSNPYMMDLTAR